jgi:hypothetical protein
MDNGILQVTLSNPDGIVTGIRYSGIDNLLEVQNDESNRGYNTFCLFLFFFFLFVSYEGQVEELKLLVIAEC